jgi:hypothetical protein
MKIHFKHIVIIALSILAFSCSKEDEMQPPIKDAEEIKDPFVENINTEKFKSLQLGYSDRYIVPVEGSMHINFEFDGDEKTSEVYIDIEPEKEIIPKKDEYVLTLEKHLLKKKRYEGVKNPKIHEHLWFTKNKKGEPSNVVYYFYSAPAAGSYKFKITVIDEKGKKSAVTKKIEIVQAYKNIEISNQKVDHIKYNTVRIKQGTENIPLEFQYDSRGRSLETMTLMLTPPDWSWSNKNDITKIIELKKYTKKGNTYSIKYNFPIDPNLVKGAYFFEISVGGVGESTSISNEIVIE